MEADIWLAAFKKSFSRQGFLIRLVSTGKLFVLDFPVQPGFMRSTYKTGDFQIPIINSVSLLKKLV
jgi:hypothetical protein